MKYYQILASDIKFKCGSFTFGEYELRPRTNQEPNRPHPIILIFDAPQLDGDDRTEYHLAYVSSLLSFVTRRRVRYCKFGPMAAPQIKVPDDGNIEFIPSSCREVFGNEIDMNNSKPFYEYTPEDETEVLNIMKKTHEKIITYQKDVQDSLIRSLYFFQLAIILENESVDLAYALLVGSIETVANNKNLFKFENQLVWTEYGPSRDWDTFFKKNAIESSIQEQIKTQLLKMEYMATKKFNSFVSKMLSDSFWEVGDPDLVYELNCRKMRDSQFANSLEGHPAISKEMQDAIKGRRYWHLEKEISRRDNLTEAQIKSIINKAYDLRSKLFHRGDPFRHQVYGDRGAINYLYDIEDGGDYKLGDVIPMKTEIVANFRLMQRIAYTCISKTIHGGKVTNT